ncbi:MAG: dTMP kinase [Tissierella sp.]|nr:dTMP kinase [Tissierella sp.]
MAGLFIALEGPDGSGKSTITKLLGDYFKDKDIDHIITREPGGTSIGEKIRELVLDTNNTEMGPETEALLYAASRGQHVHEKIAPALKEGKVVLCERFVFSSLAYQGVGRDLGIKEVKAINDFAIKDIYPDLILFFHIDPEVTLKRKTTKYGADRLEKEGNDFHNRVYNGYMELIKMYPKNIKIIDATKPINDVLNQSIKEIEDLLISKEG